MRKSMQWMVLVGEVALFAMGVTAIAKGQEYPPLKPTYVAAQTSTAKSPYAAANPVRVTMTNRDGQVTTLEYRKPVKVVSYEEETNGGLVPVTALPVLTSPAREDDLPELSSLPSVRYASQSVVRQTQYQGVPQQTLPLVQTSNTPVTAYCAPQNTVTHMLPTTTYSLPNYSVPMTTPATTVFQPVMVPPAAPVVASDVQVGKGIYGQPTIYRPGQPVRNALRYLTP